MKYITLIIGLLVNGCGKAEPELTLEEKKVIGEYEHKEGGHTSNKVFLENGIVESYVDGKKQPEQKWTIINGQIHTIKEAGHLLQHRQSYGPMSVLRINPDKSITHIAVIYKNGKHDYPKEDQVTYKKIK